MPQFEKKLELDLNVGAINYIFPFKDVLSSDIPLSNIRKQ